MDNSQIYILVTIIAYMLLVIGIGIYFSRRNKSADDFYLGGRKLGPIVTAMSAEASDMSSYLLMGIPGLAYVTGFSEAGWTIIGLAVGTYLDWLIVARRLRLYSAKAGNAITIPEFFKNRFADEGKALIGISAVIILIFFIPYTASGFAACGKLFSSLFGISYMTAMLISAVIIAIYTMLGGFLAASTTDLIQSVIMTIALFVVIIFGVSVAGGTAAVIDNAKEITGYLSLTHSANVATGETGNYTFIMIVSTLAWGLGYFGMPHFLLRFMAIKDDEKLAVSRRIASVWVVISMSVAALIGAVGYGMTKVGALPLFETTSDAERILIYISELLAQKGFFFAIIGGIIIAGILASTMSTADSQLLAASSSFSHNLLRDVFGMKLSERAMIIWARITVLIISVIAVFLARNPDSSVFRIVSFAWAGFGAAFGPLMIFSLFWRRTNKVGALVGLISGGVMVFVWKFLVRPIGGVWDIYELLPSFIVSCIFIVVGSLLTAPPKDDVTKIFDEVKRSM